GDGRMVACATDAGLIFLDARTGELQHTLALEGILTNATLCPRGRTIALVSNKGDQEAIGKVQVYEIVSGKERLAVSPAAVVRPLRFPPDGKSRATGHDDGTAIIWDLEPPRKKEAKEGEEDAWSRLSGEDATDAYRAMWQLRRDPARAVELVGKH